MWVVFALLSALFAGITAILSKIGIQKTDSTLATALRTVVVLLFSWALVFAQGLQAQLGTISAHTYLFLGLSGLATGASWLCYFQALKLGTVNQVVPVDKSSTVLTMLLAFVLLGEPIGWLKGVCIVLIALGTWLMIEKKPQFASQTVKNGKGWLPFALLSAVFAALTAILGKIGIQGVPSDLGTAIRTIVVLVMSWLIVFLRGKQKEIRQIDRKSAAFIALSGVATGLSWLCYYRALQDGLASVVVPLDKLSIVVTIAFSYLFLHEKLSKKALLGFILIVAGTGLLLL